MADATAKWALDVDADASSAVAAAGELQRYQEKILLAESSLKDIQRTMRAYKGTSLGTKEEINKLRTAELAQKEALAQAHKGFLAAGGNLKNLYKPAVKSATQDTTALKDALLQSIPGASRVVSAFKGVTLSAVGLAAGTVLLVAALAALAVGMAAGVVHATKLAIAEAELSRNQRNNIEQMLLYSQMVRRVSLGHQDAQTYARQFSNAIAEMSEDLPESNDKLAEMGQTLYSTYRLTGKALQEALRASVMVGGVDKFMALGYSAQGAGKSIHAMATMVEKQFGGNLSRRMLSLDAQVVLMRNHWRTLTKDLDLEPLLRPLKEFTDLFSQNTVTGSALKTILETMFQPLIGTAGIAGKLVKAVFQGLVIAALLAALGILKLRNYLRETFSGYNIGQIDMLKVSLATAAVALGVATAAAIMLGVALAGIVGTAAMVAAPFLGIYAVITELQSLDLKATGRNLMLGLVEGIKSGAALVVAEVQALGGKIKGPIAGALGIHSPARFGIYAGQMLGEGMAIGARSRGPQVEASAGGLARAAAGGMASGAAPRAAAPAPVMQVTIPFTYTGPTDLPPTFKHDVEDALSGALEGLAREMGVALVTGGT